MVAQQPYKDVLAARSALVASYFDFGGLGIVQSHIVEVAVLVSIKVFPRMVQGT